MFINNYKTNTLLFCIILFLWGCKERFIPPKAATKVHYLVVEGFINAGNGPTTFTLSRTRSIRDTGYAPIGGVTPPIYELGARVTVEDDQGNSFLLPEQGEGRYGGNRLYLDDERKYHLVIHTRNGKEYRSDPTAVLHTPAIDSVNWCLNADGIQIYVNTHAKHKNIYYRWEYNQTWEIHSRFHSYLEYVEEEGTQFPPNGQVIHRPPEHSHIYTCWQSERSSAIFLGSASKLDQNIVFEKPIAFIPYHSERAGVLYSIFVKQYALGSEEFEFWQRMKKNTEGRGTIFDPLPSDIVGNIHCISDPSELVIGYVGTKSVEKKRIFISNDKLPYDWNYNWHNCKMLDIPADSAWYYFGQLGLIPIQRSGRNKFSASTKTCVDCTVRGTNIKPPFWP